MFGTCRKCSAEADGIAVELSPLGLCPPCEENIERNLNAAQLTFFTFRTDQQYFYLRQYHRFEIADLLDATTEAERQHVFSVLIPDAVRSGVLQPQGKKGHKVDGKHVGCFQTYTHDSVSRLICRYRPTLAIALMRRVAADQTLKHIHFSREWFGLLAAAAAATLDASPRTDPARTVEIAAGDVPHFDRFASEQFPEAATIGPHERTRALSRLLSHAGKLDRLRRKIAESGVMDDVRPEAGYRYVRVYEQKQNAKRTA